MVDTRVGHYLERREHTVRTFAVIVIVLVVMALTLAGCPKPAAVTAPAPNANVQTPAPETTPPPAEAAKPEETGKPAEGASDAEKSADKPKAGDKEKSMGPKLEGEEGKKPITSKTGLKYIVLEEGKGSKPQKGATIVAEYTGWLTDGKKFDSSKDHPGEFSFQVGLGQVVPGWDEALSDMKVGERRKLIVPPALGYGSEGAGGVIPPNATLIFEVKLAKIK